MTDDIFVLSQTDENDDGELNSALLDDILDTDVEVPVEEDVNAFGEIDDDEEEDETPFEDSYDEE